MQLPASFDTQVRAARRTTRQVLARAGLPGMLAAVLTVCAAFVLLHLVPATTARHEQLQRDLLDALAAPARAPSHPPGLRMPVLGALPPLATNAADLVQLYALAARSGITARKADYHLSPVAATPYLAYEVNLPLSASYPRLRQFSAQAIAGLPNLAIDGIRFSREESTSDTLNAELRLVLFYRN